MPAVFALIAATMVLHGFTLAPLSRRLGLRLGDAPGLAVVGASPWSTDLVHALHQAGVPVLLIDTFPGALNPARRLGIPVLQAEILSEHGEEKLAGHAVDYLIAATADEIYNGLVCTRMMPELGRQRVFQLAPEGGLPDERRGVGRDWRGRILGDPPAAFATLQRNFDNGWRFALSAAGENAAPSAGLLVLTPSGLLHLVTTEHDGDPIDGRPIQQVPPGQAATPAALADPAPSLMA
jgi:hypothetical protein